MGDLVAIVRNIRLFILLPALFISAVVLSGCAGPTTPFGGLAPWDLHHSENSLVEAQNEFEFNQSLPILSLTLRHPASLADIEWNRRKSLQDKNQPWVLMDPEQVNYVNPIVLRIYIHDPNNNGHRPKIRLTYDDWDLTAKIKDKSNWEKISETDWQFTSRQIKFSPARVGELKVSFFSRQTAHWVGTKLTEPSCIFTAQDQDQQIEQTGRFQVDGALLEKIQTLSKSNQVNPNLIAALIAQESGFNSRAVSMSRAIGLTQVTPVAEKEILSYHPEFPQYPGLNKYSFLRLLSLVKMQEIGPNEEWRLDPEQSIRGGITYLELVRDYWARFSFTQLQNRTPASLVKNSRALSDQEELILTLASYNSGPARVKRAYLQDPKMWLKDENLSEARTYVHKISSYCANFSHGKAGQ